jgi:hypothetical protein
MDRKINQLIGQIQKLELELEAEMARRAAGLRMALDNGRIEFEEDVLRRHRELKMSLYNYISSSHTLTILTAPLIYSLIIPLILIDVFISMYQYICFPIYGIKRVKRGDFFAFDRHHLAYLNLIEKVNCAYCSYANGVIAYAMEVGSLTEARWCPIKHARRMQKTHARYKDFSDYGDVDDYKKSLDNAHIE